VEVMTKPGSVLKYRAGKLGFDNVLQSDDIWKNSSKGERAANADLMTLFGTDTPRQCLEIILNEGEVNLTAAERKEKVDKKKREMVTYVNKYFVDPRNGLPHPVTRVEQALQELNFHVDPETPVERQIQDLLKKLPDVLRIKKQGEMEGVVSVPNQHIGVCSGVLHALATVNNEEYGGSGCDYRIAVVPADYDRLVAELTRVTKGDFQINMDGGNPEPIVEEESGKKGGKKKGGKGGKGGKKGRRG